MELQDRAMLMSLGISQWTARKLDKKASAGTAALYNTETTEVSTYKSTVSKKHLDKIQKIVGAARTMHYRYTTPYPSIKGQAVLATKMLPEYLKEGAKLNREFQNAVREFLSIYDDVRGEARVALGELYNDFDYPSVEELSRKFRMTFDPSPLPVGKHFSIPIDAEALAEMQAEIEERATEAFRESVTELWGRVYAVATAMAERMEPDPSGKDKVFRDSVVDNIAELADILPKMNIAGDPNLDAMAERLQKELATYEPEKLRIDKGLRKEALKKAQDIAQYAGRQVAAPVSMPAPVAPVVVATEPVAPEPVIEPVAAPEPDDMLKKMMAAGVI